MIRSYCINNVKTRRCGRLIRARRSYKFCRSCYQEVNGVPRPIDRTKSNKVKVTKPKFEAIAPTGKGKRKK